MSLSSSFTASIRGSNLPRAGMGLEKSTNNGALISLPIDLMRPIVECLPEQYSTLYALSLTCYAMRSEADRMLYRCMKRYDWKMQIGFLKSILNHPSLASLVHVLHILPRHFQRDPNLLRNYLTIAMPEMANLEEYVDGSYQGSLRPLVEARVKFRLQRFSFTDASELEQAYYFFRFLESQSNLCRLHVKEDPNLSYDKTIAIQPLERRLVTNLQFLRGSFAALKAFLPGRKVTIVDWEPSNRMVEGEAIKIMLPIIAPYLNRIKYLCVRKYAYHIQRPSLDILSQYMEKLEYLDLPGIQSHEIEYLNLFPALHGLALTGLPSQNSTQPDYSLSDFLIRLVNRCPQLTAIIIEIRSTLQTQSNREFQIWTPLDVENEMASPPIYQLPISDLSFYHIFELLPV